MKPIKVMTVFGTRPEAIKMAPLVKELTSRDTFETICCVTAQHRQMLDSVLNIFDINPDFDLNIMETGQSLYKITAKALTGMERVLKNARPDIILVHGDTSSSFAGALSAFYEKIPVGHVEAGLRTFDRYSPFPEEMNRRLVTEISELHFCPTATNSRNLNNESIRAGVFVTGNTVIDALKTTVRDDFRFSPAIESVLGTGRLILVTAHRRENYGRPMREIFSALARIANDFKDVRILYPVHPSPVVRGAASELLSNVPRVFLIDPVDADEMHNLIARCHMVITDSGGLQEEAPALGKPVLVVRRETERPEAVEAGTVKMAGVNEETIYKLASELLSSPSEYAKMARAVNPYGDGKACARIADIIEWRFGLREAPLDEFSPKQV